KHSRRERRQRVCFDARIVEFAADSIRDSEHPGALSADEEVADEWNPAEHRIERVGWEDAATKVDRTVRLIDAAVDGDPDGPNGRRLAHVQPIAGPSERNLRARDQDPFAPEHAGDAVERAEAENLRHDGCLHHAEVARINLT